MVLERDQSTGKFKAERPTVKKYLDGLLHDDTSLYRTRNQMRENHNNLIATGSSTNPNSLVARGPQPETNAALTNSESNFLAKVAASKRRKPPTVEEVAVGNRVNPLVAELQNSLRSTQFS